MFENFHADIDYSGQKYAEQLGQYVFALFSVISFMVGYYAQKISYCMYILLVGVFVVGVLTLPPWPMFNKDPIQWQKPITEETNTSQAKTSNGKKQK